MQYDQEDRAAVSGMLVGLRVGRLDVYRSAKARWSHRHPGKEVVVGEFVGSWHGSDYKPSTVENADLRKLTLQDLSGVKFDQVKFMNPQLAGDAVTAALRKAGARVEEVATTLTAAAVPATVVTVPKQAQENLPERKLGVDLKTALMKGDVAAFSENLAAWRAQHPGQTLELGKYLGQAGPIAHVDFTLFKRDNFEGVSLNGATFIGACFPRGSMNPPYAVTEPFIKKLGATLEQPIQKAMKWETPLPRDMQSRTGPSATGLLVPDQNFMRRISICLKSGGSYFRDAVNEWRAEHPGKIMDLGGAFQMEGAQSVSNVDFDRFSPSDFDGVSLRGAKFLGAYLSSASGVSKTWLDGQGVVWDICYTMDGMRHDVSQSTSPAPRGR